MPNQRDVQRLAPQGGMKAVTRIEGKGKPRIGLEGFMSVAERFGFAPEALKRIRVVVTEEGLASARRDGAQVWSHNMGLARGAWGFYQQRVGSQGYHQWADQ
jgi:hypothetical protein